MRLNAGGIQGVVLVVVAAVALGVRPQAWFGRGRGPSPTDRLAAGVTSVVEGVRGGRPRSAVYQPPPVDRDRPGAESGTVDFSDFEGDEPAWPELARWGESTPADSPGDTGPAITPGPAIGGTDFTGPVRRATRPCPLGGCP